MLRPYSSLADYLHRPVLVTGADGFVGSHLVDALLALGAQVHVLVRRPPQDLRNLAPVRDQISLHQADICNYDQVLRSLKVLQGAEGLILFHLAAQAHVGDSWQIPEITLQTNVLGTLNLLQAVKELRLNLRCFDYAGSSEEYGSVDSTRRDQYHQDFEGKTLLNETSPLNPKSVYAASKVAGDFLARSFFDAYGLPVVVTRMFNNFGPRQNPRFITGTVITQALRQEVVEIGSPHARRDFTYIADGVRGHLWAAITGKPGEVYAFGQGKNVSIGDWTQMILTIGQEHDFWPQRELKINLELYRPGSTDEADLLADATKLRQLTGWEPEVSWEEGLSLTIAWYARLNQISKIKD